MCEILIQYGAEFTVHEGDPFLEKPQKIPKEETEKENVEPLPVILKYKEEPKLRFYQEEAIEKMVEKDKGILIMATGTGKTVVFCNYIKRVGGKWLIIVPSVNLIKQTIKKCESILPNSFVISRYKNNMNTDSKNMVIVGTYQNSHNIQNLGEIDGIIFDECHRTVITVLEKDKEDMSRFQTLLRYRCEKKFFFTATVKNLISEEKSVISMDNREIYGDTIYTYDTSSAITDGFLTDYNIHLVATTDKNETTKKYIEKRVKSIVFCSNVQKVENLYRYLSENLSKKIGVFKLGERDNTDKNTELFSTYKGQAVIIVCKKLDTGYDEPQLDTVLHYDISDSSITTGQRNGRGSRIYKDKVMTTIVFLCDVSGDEESRKKEIQKLQRPIAYLKALDSRLEKRIEKESLKSQDEYKTIDIQVEEKTTESVEIYNRFWRLLNESKITYKKAKEIISKSQKVPVSKEEYKKLVVTDTRLPEDPETKFTDFIDWVDYLGIDREKYYTKTQCQEKIKERRKEISDSIKPTEKCEKLMQTDSRFPPVDMWKDFYRLKKLEDIFKDGQKWKK